MSEREKFRSPAEGGVNSTLKNKYLPPAAFGVVTYFICFSSAKKFLAFFSPALDFSFVRSLVPRQENERFAHLLSRRILRDMSL